TLTLSLGEEADLHYFSTIIEYDNDLLEYLTTENIGITDPGLHIDGHVATGKVGVGVSRADSTPISEAGDFMEVTFRLKSKADPGSLTFTFLDPEMSDSAGDPIAVQLGDPDPLPILEGIGEAELLNPSHSTITEGEAFLAEGRVYAGGISGDGVREEELEAWVGIHSTSAHPETWPESAWIRVQPAEAPEEASESDVEEYSYFRADVADRKEAGEWHLSIRTRLEGESWHYGGLESFSSGGTTTLPALSVEPQPDWRYDLAAWEFESGQLTPERFVMGNDTSKIHVQGMPPLDEPVQTSESDGVTWLDTNGWQPVDGMEKALTVVVTTDGFVDLQLSSSHTGTSAGPAGFQVQLSTDGEVWEDLDGGAIDLAAESTVHLENLELDKKWEGLGRLWIRWHNTSEERIDGDESPISNGSYHRIGRIRLTGKNPDPVRTDVWPGDANGDGEVNAEDVLLLGYYWRAHGPEPAYGFLEFTPRKVEQWIPAEATAADTDGNGVVDHRDLKAIGLNFGGREPEESESREKQETLAATAEVSEFGPLQLALPALETGEEIDVSFRIPRRESFQGVAFRLRMDSDQTPWELSLGTLPGPAEGLNRDGQLITFTHQAEHFAEAAWGLPGREETLTDYEMATVRIRATEAWQAPPVLSLEWFSVARSDGTVERLDLEGVEMSLSEAAPPNLDLPGEEEITLYQNYPNPFYPETTIRYYLPEPQPVRLDVYDLNGRRVATLVRENRPAGLHSLQFDAGSLASGIYFVRLQSGRLSEVRKMVVVR
ncbi:MAG: T9SS type A sorting domain-containing protein, partial [Balneolaceae bacterium]